MLRSYGRMAGWEASRMGAVDCGSRGGKLNTRITCTSRMSFESNTIHAYTSCKQVAPDSPSASASADKRPHRLPLISASDHAPNVQILPIIEITRGPVTARLPVYACGVGDERVQ
jgi:hypothetical protein